MLCCYDDDDDNNNIMSTLIAGKHIHAAFVRK